MPEQIDFVNTSALLTERFHNSTFGEKNPLPTSMIAGAAEWEIHDDLR